jgi:hypothetical protein
LFCHCEARACPCEGKGSNPDNKKEFLTISWIASFFAMTDTKKNIQKREIRGRKILSMRVYSDVNEQEKIFLTKKFEVFQYF